MPSQSIARVQARAEQKARLVARLRRREKALFEAELALRAAYEGAEAEAEDVEALESVGLEHAFASLTGRYQERLDKETRELALARIAVTRLDERVRRLKVDVTRLQAAVDALGTPERQLTRPTTKGAAVTRRLFALQAAIEEGHEAQDAVRFARAALERASRYGAGRRAPPSFGGQLARLAQQRLHTLHGELSGLWACLDGLPAPSISTALPRPDVFEVDLARAWQQGGGAWRGLFDETEAALSDLEETLAVRLAEGWAGSAAGPDDWDVGALFE